MRREEFEWLERQVQKLKNVMDALHDFDLSEYESYEVHPWTPLKLICLMWWLSIYTHIIPNYFRNYWYIDLFSGPGLNFVRETRDYLPGSPILACNSYKPFTQYIFIEKNRQRYESLKRILSRLNLSNCRIYNEDCYAVISNLHINADHSFIFADCEKPSDIRWGTIEKLLRHKSDLIVVFHTESVNRVLGRARKSGKSDTLTEMLGDDSWRNAESGSEVLDIFMKKLRSYREFVKSIKIRGSYRRIVKSRGGRYSRIVRYSYDVILACRKGRTRDYTNAWIELGEKMTYLRHRDAELVLRILKGEIRALDEFERRMQGTRRIQRTLTDFA